MCGGGGWRGEKDKQRRLISILDVSILSIVLEFGNHVLKILTNGSLMVAEWQGKSRNYVNKKKKMWLFYKIEGGCDGNFCWTVAAVISYLILRPIQCSIYYDDHEHGHRTWRETLLIHTYLGGLTWKLITHHSFEYLSTQMVRSQVCSMEYTYQWKETGVSLSSRDIFCMLRGDWASIFGTRLDSMWHEALSNWKILISWDMIWCNSILLGTENKNLEKKKVN